MPSISCLERGLKQWTPFNASQFCRPLIYCYMEVNITFSPLIFSGYWKFSLTHLFLVQSLFKPFILSQIIRKSCHIKPQQSCNKSSYQSKLVFFNLTHLFTVLVSIFNPAKAVCRKIVSENTLGCFFSQYLSQRFFV